MDKKCKGTKTMAEAKADLRRVPQEIAELPILNGELRVGALQASFFAYPASDAGGLAIEAQPTSCIARPGILAWLNPAHLDEPRNPQTNHPTQVLHRSPFTYATSTKNASAVPDAKMNVDNAITFRQSNQQASQPPPLTHSTNMFDHFAATSMCLRSCRASKPILVRKTSRGWPWYDRTEYRA